MATMFNDGKVVGVNVVGGTLPSGGNVASGAADAGNPVKVGGVFNTTPPTVSTGQRVDAQFNSRGILLVNLSVDGVNSGTFTSGVSSDNLGQASAFNVNSFNRKWNGAGWDRDRKPTGASRILSAAATTNATSAKASPGDLHLVTGNNASGAVRYLKFYNKASAPTVGTDTPVLTLALPTGVFQFNLAGFYFATGIAYALTTGAPDADTGALTLADILGLNITYA